MYSYSWDADTGGLLLNSSPLAFSKEPRPVYYKELDILGFDKYWSYAKNDTYPYMWAEANNYFYRGRQVAKTKGGSLYTAPEIILLDDPEPEGTPLRFVDIPSMVEKNRSIMEKLAAETIKKIYNTYVDYKNKVDVFHVSYSGGKDSEVTLDLVQRAIPHTDFVAIFGDTGMEFPDTYLAVEKTRAYCEEQNIAFYVAKASQNVMDTWAQFGPPSKTIRWCCSVHKTAPQLLKLREITGKTNFREMSFVGVRSDESLRRSEYDYISFGTKHQGQYSYNPILEWNSAEVYLYIFQNALQLNDAYKKGNPRAGCLVCPMSADKSDYMRNACYSKQVRPFMDMVAHTSVRALETEADTRRYIESGGWKLRNNGRDIYTIPVKYSEAQDAETVTLKVHNPSTPWEMWIKTIGKLNLGHNGYTIENQDVIIPFSLENDSNGYVVRIKRGRLAQEVKLIKLLKQVFRKSAYCIQCRECEANCSRGCIQMKDGKFRISDQCIKCGNCQKIPDGCLLYHSVTLPKRTGKMNTTSLDHYADHAPKMEWIVEFFNNEERFFESNSLGSVMNNMFKRFLKDAGLAENNLLTDFAYVIKRLGLERPASWGLMLVNLAYTSEFQWYIKNIRPYESYTRTEMMEMLVNSGAKDRASKSVSGAYRRILALPFGSEIGLGYVEKDGKEYIYRRQSWRNPDPKVVLYSLYKFAEACGDYYQFTLTRLLDHEIDSDGVSPTEIFGLDREQMEKLLNGLSINYPDYINASFTLDLDSITLNSEKTSQDVLQLF